MNRYTFFLLLAAVLLFGCTKEKGSVPVVTPTPAVECATTISYATDIVPIISTSCSISSSCHASGSFYGDFTSYAGLKIDADNGKLNDRVVVMKDMPSTGTLADSLRTKIKCWILQGSMNN